MQPRPREETSGPRLPSLRLCMAVRWLGGGLMSTLGSKRPHRAGNVFGLEAGDLEPLRRLCNFATTLGASGWQLHRPGDASRQGQTKEGIGSRRIRFPVAAKIALQTAGARAGSDVSRPITGGPCLR